MFGFSKKQLLIVAIIAIVAIKYARSTGFPTGPLKFLA